MTIKELLRSCEYQIRIGNGDKKIFISSDDEGNDWHELLFTFTNVKEAGVEKYRLEDMQRYHKLEDIILLG